MGTSWRWNGSCILVAMLVAVAFDLSAAEPPAGPSQTSRGIAPAESVRLDLRAEATAQYQALVVQIANRRWFEWDFVVKYAADPQSLIRQEDRDPLDVVLRRTKALLQEVRRLGPRYDLSVAAKRLQAIEAKAQDLPAAEIPRIEVREHRAWVAFAPPPPGGPRYGLFLEVCALRRQIALANPLLDFDQILFIKRAQPHFGHMVGYPGKGGGEGDGLYVLGQPFSPVSTLRNLLADAAKDDSQPPPLDLARPVTVCSFDLSYDGQTILFSAMKGKWSLFRIGVDGRGLRRLTDGSYNDCDPCIMPDGRVVFLSDQRGGYGRCHGGGDERL